MKDIEIDNKNKYEYNNDILNIDISNTQFVKKCGKHCLDYGLNPNNESDRKNFKKITFDIINNYD